MARALLCALALAVCACVSRRASDVTVYTSVDQSYAEPVLRRIEQRTGLTVAAVYDIEAAKTTGLVNRLLAEKAHPVADVFWSSECLQTLRLDAAGVLAPYRPSSGPTVEALGNGTAFGGRLRVLLVNTSRVAEEQSPRSIDDLLGAAWPAERVGLALPLFGTTATHAAALYAARGPQAARAFFARVKERGIRVVDGNSTVRDLVASGDLWWGVTDSDDAQAALRRGDAPLRMVIPDQHEGGGALLIPMSVAVIAGAPHSANGRRLADALLSPETLSALADQGFVFPAGPSAVRLMPVSWPALFGHFARTQADMREIFVR
jgi:iron(III) transport system substrate-binding protein